MIELAVIWLLFRVSSTLPEDVAITLLTKAPATSMAPSKSVPKTFDWNDLPGS